MGTDPSEATVPLFMISHEPLVVDTAFRASHGNIFAALLDLMNVPEPARQDDYPISLLKARESDAQPRAFWVGSLNRDVLSGRVAFDRW